MIELYTEKYREGLTALIKEFYDESLNEYGQKFEVRALNLAIETNKQHTFVLIINGECRGVISGHEVNPPYSAERVFQEMVWFISKPCRTRGVFFLKSVLSTLKQEGFGTIVMAVMHNSNTEKLLRLYQRMGFVPFETHCIKKL